MPRRHLAGQAVKQSVKAPLRRLIRHLGYEITGRGRDQQAVITALIRDLRVATLLDIGANQGQYAEHARANGFLGRMISFEPGSEAFRRLESAARRDPQWEARRVALGAERSELTLHISANSVSSSFLEIGSRHVEAAPSSATVGGETVRVERLDVECADVSGPLMMKIDTQGYELPVLEGAEGILDRVQLIQAELSLVELYPGQASYLEVLTFLEDRDFTPCFLLPGFSDPDSGQMLQVDVVARRCHDRP